MNEKEKAIEIYERNSKILSEHIFNGHHDIAIEISINEAVEMLNAFDDKYSYSIEGGYSQPSGTVLYEEVLGLDEYNIKNSFITSITRTKNTFSFVSKYRADSYGTEFARRKPKAIYPIETKDMECTSDDSLLFDLYKDFWTCVISELKLMQ